MFCNNCGNQIGEGERFCSKCGTAIVIEKKADTCPRCHATVEEGAKFCNKCGASLTAPQKTVCHGCGKPLEEGEQFCKSCGKAVGGVKLTDQIVEGIGKISDGKIKLSKYFGSSADPFSSLRLKHMIIGWALALLAVFCLVIPVVAVEVPILSFFSDDESATIYISMIGFMTIDGEAAEALELEGLAGMFAFVSIVEMLVLAGAAFYMLRPTFNGQVIKRRMFILPLYAVVSSFIGMMAQLSIFGEACDQVNDQFGARMADASMTFFGVLSVLIHIGVFVLLLLTTYQNKKIVRHLSGGLI